LISQYFDVSVVGGPEFGPQGMTGGRFAMLVHGLLGKAAGTVVTGLVGVSAYEVVRKALAKAPLHDAAVTATQWGLRGTRRAEEAAESARLKVADVVAEARERIGEEAQPPAIGDHDHEH
jgi:chaperone-like protein